MLVEITFAVVMFYDDTREVEGRKTRVKGGIAETHRMAARGLSRVGGAANRGAGTGRFKAFQPSFFNLKRLEQKSERWPQMAQISQIKTKSKSLSVKSVPSVAKFWVREPWGKPSAAMTRKLLDGGMLGRKRAECPVFTIKPDRSRSRLIAVKGS
jgi:hypothetical protein